MTNCSAISAPENTILGGSPVKISAHEPLLIPLPQYVAQADPSVAFESCDVWVCGCVVCGCVGVGDVRGCVGVWVGDVCTSHTVTS